MSKVIVVDDVKSYCETVCEELKSKGISAVGCQTVKKAKWLIERAKRTDVLLVDLMLNDESGENGTDILRWMREKGYLQPFYLMTGYGTMENAIETMELGAVSYFKKEEMGSKFYAHIKDIMQEQELKEKRNDQIAPKRNCQPFQDIQNDIRRISSMDVHIVIEGESGTGRGHLAEDIISLTGMSEKPRKYIACGTLDSVADAKELFFGHVKGAFSSAVSNKPGVLAQVNGGTLILEDVDKMPIRIQELLIPVFRHGTFLPNGADRERMVEFRLISITSTSLEASVEEGRMDREFYEFVCEHLIQMPSLRETQEDIVPVAEFFLDYYRTKRQKFSHQAKRLIQQYPWPGNLREMAKAVRTALRNCDDEQILPEHLGISLKDGKAKRALEEMNLHSPSEEKEKITEALKSVRFNKSKAARILGISRKTIDRKIEKYGIETH